MPTDLILWGIIAKSGQVKTGPVKWNLKITRTNKNQKSDSRIFY